MLKYTEIIKTGLKNVKSSYLEIARRCWDSVKNIHYLPPAVYGMKVAYERYIKELENKIKGE